MNYQVKGLLNVVQKVIGFYPHAVVGVNIGAHTVYYWVQDANRRLV